MKEHHEIIFIGIILVFLFIILFVAYLEAGYTKNHHNRIAFYCDGTPWMELSCTISTINGRYLSVDDNNKLIYQIFPDEGAQWTYIYNNSNPNMGTFRNRKTRLFMSFSSDSEGELLVVDQAEINMGKLFTSTRRTETDGIFNHVTIESPSGYYITSGGDGFIYLELFSQGNSLFTVASDW